MALQQPGVGGFVFFADNFDVVKIFGEAGAGNLTFLIKQIAFGDEQQGIFSLQRLQRFRYVWQNFYGMVEHDFAQVNDLLNFGAVYLPFG